MSDKTSTLKKPIKNGKKFFLLYSAAFLVCAALCYFWFIINKKTLIINSDGWAGGSTLPLLYISANTDVKF